MRYTYAKCTQDLIQEYGAVVSTNGRSRISVTESFDHLDVPAYPKTSADGVIHFVHFASPLIGTDASKAEAKGMISKHMSKVCITYTLSEYVN